MPTGKILFKKPSPFLLQKPWRAGKMDTHRSGLIAFITAAVCFSGCKPYKTYHGHIIKSSEMASLTIGRTTKNQVIARLGGPTNILPYDPNTLYYLSHVVINQSLLKTQPLSSKCYALVFSSSGILSHIVGSGAIYPVTPCSDKIPLPSKHEESFLEQMMRSFESNIANTKITPV